MSLVDNNGGLSAADVAAVMNGNGNNGFGFGGDGAWWLLVLFLFAFNGNGWGNNGGGAYPFMNQQNDVQRGFDHQAVMSGINGLTTAINTGFANAEVSRCNGQMNTVQNINGLAMALQNACSDNRSGIADLKYTIATEACADRNAVSNALRDVIASNTANTQVILDKMCQQEIEALKTQNANLQTQLNMAALNASQADQTAKILANNAAQTAALQQSLNPTPVPAYVVQNPACCNTGYFGGCGCGTVA